LRKKSGASIKLTQEKCLNYLG